MHSCISRNYQHWYWNSSSYFLVCRFRGSSIKRAVTVYNIEQSMLGLKFAPIWRHSRLVVVGINELCGDLIGISPKSLWKTNIFCVLKSHLNHNNCRSGLSRVGLSRVGLSRVGLSWIPEIHPFTGVDVNRTVYVAFYLFQNLLWCIHQDCPWRCGGPVSWEGNRIITSAGRPTIALKH
jgi:hypothetical protein